MPQTPADYIALYSARPRTMLYFNEYAQTIAEDAAGVNEWLAAHPGYIGAIWANHGDGSEDFEVTDIFRPEEMDRRASDRAAMRKRVA